MKPNELIEMVRRVSLLRGFAAALATSGAGTVFALANNKKTGHGRLEEALDTIVSESTEACSRMSIGDFVRAEIDVQDGHIYVAVADQTRLVGLFDGSAHESAVRGRMDDIFEEFTGATAQ